MNRIGLVEDLDWTDVRGENYDLAIFASGHESRASYIASFIDQSLVKSVRVFGFDTDVEAGARLINDATFRRLWKCEPIVLSNRAEEWIYTYLSAEIAMAKRWKLLVDYSSMTRFWYAAILNWCRFLEPCEQIDIDFVYCAGEYAQEIPTLQIDDILSLPGCEGNTASAGPSVALLGLGFDNNAVQCVLDDMEPDIVQPFIAGGAARTSYIEKVKHVNAELLLRCGAALELPLESVATTVTCLSEVAAPYNEKFNISIIPLGPKPHVLASVLLAMKLPRVAALHVSGRRAPPWDALPTERIICTRVRFRPTLESRPEAG